MSIRSYLNDSCQVSHIPWYRRYIPGHNWLGTSQNYYSLSPKQQRRLQRKPCRVWAMHVPYGWHTVLQHCQRPYYMTIVRDPHQRVLSHYNFFFKGLGYAGFKGRPIHTLTEAELHQVLLPCSNVQAAYISGRSIKGGIATTEDMDIAKKNIVDKYQFVGRIEHLDHDILYLKDHVPSWLRMAETVPFKNTSIHSDPIHTIGQHLMDMIESYNQLDMELHRFVTAYIQGR